MNIDNIHAELKALNQWAVFRTYFNDKKQRYEKVIISPVTGEFAKSDAPETWEEFGRAAYFMKRNRYQGLTFALGSGISVYRH